MRFLCCLLILSGCASTYTPKTEAGARCKQQCSAQMAACINSLTTCSVANANCLNSCADLDRLTK